MRRDCLHNVIKHMQYSLAAKSMTSGVRWPFLSFSGSIPNQLCDLRQAIKLLVLWIMILKMGMMMIVVLPTSKHFMEHSLR